jgi:hypothetical protein
MIAADLADITPIVITVLLLNPEIACSIFKYPIAKKTIRKAKAVRFMGGKSRLKNIITIKMSSKKIRILIII